MTAKLLANQYRSILAEPVEGFTVELADDSSLYEWKVFIEGPKDTCYEGGVFQLQLSFPKDYPMAPPTLKFLSDFWHPNVYTDGKVCMSILHPPGEDAMSGELARERWLPTQSVTTIILSLLSLLNDPNCSSAANVDASVEWRDRRKAYIAKCKKLVEKANREKPAHVVIPHPDTNEEEHKRIVQKWKEMNSGMSPEDFYDPHSDNHETEESDENEDEFLESNDDIDSDGPEKEVDREAEPAPKKDKGKAPAISVEIVRNEDERPANMLATSSSSLGNESTQNTQSQQIAPPSSHPPPLSINIENIPVNNVNDMINDNSNSNRSNNSNNNVNTDNVSSVSSVVLGSSNSSKRKKSKSPRKKKCIIM